MSAPPPLQGEQIGNVSNEDFLIHCSRITKKDSKNFSFHFKWIWVTWLPKVTEFSADTGKFCFCVTFLKCPKKNIYFEGHFGTHKNDADYPFYLIRFKKLFLLFFLFKVCTQNFRTKNKQN